MINSRKTKSTTAVLVFNKRIFWSLMVTIGVLITLYGYFVSQSIFHVVLREEIEQEIIAVHSKISELEYSYLNKKNNINLTLAYSLGYTKIEDKHFVTRKSLSSTQLTLRGESR